ncbi:MAG: hypothetical protein ACTHJ5_12465 [Ilyomonas sp.]
MNQAEKQEVTLRDVIIKIHSGWLYLRSKWLLIAAFVLAGAALGYYYAKSSMPKYSAQLSFILSNNSSSGSTLAGFAGQFGLNLDASSSDAFSGDNIISLMTSRNMVQQALMKKIPETNETLLNSFVKDMNLDKAWSKKERTKNAYPFPADSSKMSYVQDSLVRSIYETIKNRYLEVTRPDKAQSVYLVNTTFKDQLFANYLTTYLVNVTSRFYIDTKTSVAKDNLDMLQHEADSLGRLLSTSISKGAAVYDYTYNLNPALQSQRAPAQESQLRTSALGTAYGEVMRNLELAKINLMKETPLYQIIDEPHLPLVAKKPGTLLSLIFGAFLAGFIIIVYLLIRKVINLYL